MAETSDADEPALWAPERDVRSALIIVAHPDDAEFGAAGTVARWVAGGAEVTYCVITDGASGSDDPGMTRERLAAIRQAEQRDAATELGVAHVEFLGYPDGFLTADLATRRDVAAVIRRARPEVVFTMNPEVRFTQRGRINHPDHRAAGDLVLHCLNPAATAGLWDPSLLEEGLEPFKPAQLWLTNFGWGPSRVDITATFEKKLAALRAHASQLGDWDPRERLTEWAAELGRPVGVDLAEGFSILPLRDLDPE